MNGNGVWKFATAFLAGALLAGISGYFAFDFRYGDALADIKVIKRDVAAIQKTQEHVVVDVNSIRIRIATFHPDRIVQ